MRRAITALRAILTPEHRRTFDVQHGDATLFDEAAVNLGYEQVSSGPLLYRATLSKSVLPKTLSVVVRIDASGCDGDNWSHKIFVRPTVLDLAAGLSLWTVAAYALVVAIRMAAFAGSPSAIVAFLIALAVGIGSALAWVWVRDRGYRVSSALVQEASRLATLGGEEIRERKSAPLQSDTKSTAFQFVLLLLVLAAAIVLQHEGYIAFLACIGVIGLSGLYLVVYVLAHEPVSFRELFVPITASFIPMAIFASVCWSIPLLVGWYATGSLFVLRHVMVFGIAACWVSSYFCVDQYQKSAAQLISWIDDRRRRRHEEPLAEILAKQRSRRRARAIGIGLLVLLSALLGSALASATVLLAVTVSNRSIGFSETQEYILVASVGSTWIAVIALWVSSLWTNTLNVPKRKQIGTADRLLQGIPVQLRTRISVVQPRHGDPPVAMIGSVSGQRYRLIYDEERLGAVLSPGEEHALVAHEVAHLVLGHCRKRSRLRALSHVMLFGDLGFSLAEDGWKMELAADRYAVSVLGASRHDLISAIQVADHVRAPTRDDRLRNIYHSGRWAGYFHPTARERSEHLLETASYG